MEERTFNSTMIPENITGDFSADSNNTRSCIQGLWIYGPEFMYLKYIIDIGIMPLVIIGGTLGNGVSFWILQSMKGVSTTVVLQALAVADSLYLFNCLFFQTLKTLYTYDDNFARIFPSFPYWEARVAWPLGNTTQTLAVWLVVLLTAERYWAICFPLKSKQLLTRGKNRIWIVSVCCLALVFNAPTHLDLQVFNIPTRGCTNLRPKEAFPSRLFGHLYYNIFYKTIACLIFRSVGPFCILIVLNYRLVKALEISKQGTNQVTTRGSNHMNAVVRIVVCAFLICQAPDVMFRILRCIKFYYPAFGIDWGVYAYLATFTNLLVALNSAINFLLYCITGGRFRQILLKKLGCVNRHSDVVCGTRTHSKTTETLLSASANVSGSKNASATDVSKICHEPLRVQALK